ncbi:tRNA (adenosine(37)-N6)-threonylcarbamoyltransferase complex transferase subunit TsaD [Campylobacter mucosalis]|uniref:tRNA (adenosine(37)-N6)-threonylcarbamoyltransferase complex transferase subunit TsaD n=1 Tax=Campylobacter mucosalis TaxID=202 RepID=UPI00146FD54A|nr:tRNA (adenosine(37)-N6)-threonylcarbamoyltransferase complex transferase subunit TsaD [Campylobacter mucosalis]
MILGIESSCDDSSVALLRIDDLAQILHKKISQEEAHSVYGGVVPELAARLHTQALPALLNDIKPYFKQIKAIAITNEPGLSVSLIGGVSMAKALSISLKIPLIAINHLVGHIYSLFLSNEIALPLGILLVSGGHTMVLDIDENKNISIIAKTTDDSFGESFDKTAKMMGLGYPGGQIISNYARECKDKDRFSFTIPLLGDKRLEYSFSGLKNQARLQIQSLENLTQKDISDISFAFEKTACAHIMDKLKRIFNERKFKRFGVVGGASANPVLRDSLKDLCKNSNCELLLAPLEFCSDNAMMIARAGREKFLNDEFTCYKDLKISPKTSELRL